MVNSPSHEEDGGTEAITSGEQVFGGIGASLNERRDGAGGAVPSVGMGVKER